jgi:SAM-dependent methyltransferase
VEQGLYDEFADVGERHWWFVARRRVIHAVIAASVPAASPDERAVLDVGCGTGEMLEMLGEFGRVRGLDFSERAVEYCKERLGASVDVAVGRIPEDIPTSGDLGLVTAFDVIEHLDDAVGGLRTMYQGLEPGGWLVVTVPAYKFLWSAHDDQNHHKRRYTRRLLRRHLTGAGFAVERMSYFNTLLFPPVAAIRVGRKLLPGRDETASDLKMPGDRMNALLLRVFAAEAPIVSRMPLPFGVSLIAVARRPM